MTESRIDELLEKLQELDPDAYMAWCELFHAIYDIDYDCIDWDGFAGAIYLLQGVIQAAIATPERGLALVIEYPVQGGEWWCAELMEKSSGVSRIRIGPTAAEAILAAYVAMLEAAR